MLQTETRPIGDTTYHVRQLGATKGRAMLVRLTRVLGPVLATLMEGNAARPKASRLPPREAPASTEASEPAPAVPTMADRAVRLGRILEADSTTVSKALTELASRLTVDDLEYVVREFGQTTQVAVDLGEKGTGLVPLNTERQELHFAGRYGQMFRWIGFCLEVNYRDFFKGSGITGPDGDPEAAEAGSTSTSRTG